MPESPSPSAASAARRPTADPNVFLVPESYLPEGFAEMVETGDFVPAAPRPAATVVLARDAGRGHEALLLRRHRRSGFAADAWVFPGGVVDAGDGAAALLARLDGPSPGDWAARLGVGDGAMAAAFVVAAIREAFEETGILLARDGSGNPPPSGALDAERAALLAGTAELAEIATGRELRLSGGDLAYMAHWVTPEPEPRRYDTRFFIGRVPAGARCEVHDAEMVDAVWLPPAEAVARFGEGELKMLPPTVHTLRRLAAFADLDEAFGAVRAAPVPEVLPRMRRVPEGVEIVVESGQ